MTNEERLEARRIMIERIKADDGSRPCCYILHRYDGQEYLVDWHGSGDRDTPVDFFLFQESFRADNLQEWQAKLLEETWEGPTNCALGQRSPARAHQTHIVSYHIRIEDVPGLLQAFKDEYIGGYEYAVKELQSSPNCFGAVIEPLQTWVSDGWKP